MMRTAVSLVTGQDSKDKIFGSFAPGFKARDGIAAKGGAICSKKSSAVSSRGSVVHYDDSTCFRRGKILYLPDGQDLD